MAAEKQTGKAEAKPTPKAAVTLEEDGGLPAAVVLAMSQAELDAVCKAAGKKFGGVTIVGDRAYL